MFLILSITSIVQHFYFNDRKLSTEIINPEKTKKKPDSGGYSDGVTLLFKEARASEFIQGGDHIKILNSANKIVLDTPRIRDHARQGLANQFF